MTERYITCKRMDKILDLCEQWEEGRDFRRTALSTIVLLHVTQVQRWFSSRHSSDHTAEFVLERKNIILKKRKNIILKKRYRTVWDWLSQRDAFFWNNLGSVIGL